MIVSHKKATQQNADEVKMGQGEKRNPALFKLPVLSAKRRHRKDYKLLAPY